MVEPNLVVLGKYGLLGAVLAWTMWRQYKDSERMFTAMKEVTTALEKFTVKLEQLWESR